MHDTLFKYCRSWFPVLLMLAGPAARAQAGKQLVPNTALYREIAVQDSLMFAAFNEHNTDKLMSFFDSTLEFYHDKGGLTLYDQTAKNFRSLFDNNKTTGMRRDLVAGSLEVYPVKDFGAIETCLHRFCHMENGKPDCGTFKNVMVWRKQAGQWKVVRVISYDH